MSELGEILRSARQKKNVSLADVAKATRIKQPYLEALEDEDYALLPGSAYITGFLRNYASYLGLHPDDVVQEYHASAPPPEPCVKAATRVLANSHRRYARSRFLWGLGILVLMLGAGYAIKQYNDTYAHPYSAPLLTPANLGAPAAVAVHRHTAPPLIHVQLRALAPVWVRVTVDKQQAFQGILRAREGAKQFTAHHALYVVTYDGAHVKVIYDGRRLGRMANKPGLVVDLATTAGWQRVS